MTGSWKFCVDDPGVCDPRILASSMPEHPAAQQVEPGPSVHLPLDDLEPVDLALDLAVAPRLGQGGAHRVLIAPEAGGERRQGAGLRLAQPAVERIGHLVLDHRHEAADEIDGGGDGGGALQQRGDEPAVGVVERVGLTGQQANRPARRGRFGGLGCCRLASHVGRRGGRVLPPAPGRPRAHDARLTGKALRLQVAPQGGGVVTAGLPTLLQVRPVRVENAGAAVGVAPRRGLAGPQPPPHRLASEAESPGDRLQRQTLPAQARDLGEAGIAAFLRRPRPPLGGPHRPLGFGRDARFRDGGLFRH